MKLSEQDVLDFARTLLGGEEQINANTELFSTGLLDSVAMMSLITFLEERTGQQVAAHEVTLENFDTPARILAFLATHG